MSGFVPSISLEKKVISGPQVVHPFELMKLLKSDPMCLEWSNSWVTARCQRSTLDLSTILFANGSHRGMKLE